VPAGLPPAAAAAAAAALTPITETLQSTPNVVISDFSTIATVGLEIYLAVFVLDANIAIDLAKASLVTASNPIGFAGNAMSANLALRLAF
jgi:hypothetical protein